jgi:hypothetical protein
MRLSKSILEEDFEGKIKILRYLVSPLRVSLTRQQ